MPTLPRRRAHLAAAASLTVLAVAGVVVLPTAGHAGVLAGPTEVAVVPAGAPQTTPQDYVGYAGATGYLHQRDNGQALLWTRYDDGQTTPVAALARMSPSLIQPAGGDYVAVVNGAQDTLVINLSDQSSKDRVIPTGLRELAASADTLLVRGSATTDATLDVIAYAADGSTTITPVTGLPAGVLVQSIRVSDGVAAFVRYSYQSATWDALVDLHTGVATTMPTPDLVGVSYELSPTHVVRWVLNATSPTVEVYSRAGLVDGSQTAPTTLAAPNITNPRWALAGDHLIYASNVAGSANPAWDLPLNGGAATQVLPRTQSGPMSLVTGPDGMGLVVGGSGPSDWAAHRFTTAADGRLADDASVKIVDSMTNAGVSLARGMLRHIQGGTQSNGSDIYMSFDKELVNDPTDGAAQGVGYFNTPLATCAAGVKCVNMIDGNEYGPLYLFDQGSNSVETSIEEPGGTRVLGTPIVPAGGAQITDASGYYAIVNGTTPATQYIVSYAQNKILLTEPVHGAALWYSTLWRTTSTAGDVTATNLNTTTTPSRTVHTGAPCVPTELQADNNWLYWSCGSTGPAGAYNTSTGARVSLTAGVALLGDGYVVQHAAGSTTLQLYDFHGGTLAGPVHVATLPATTLTDDRHIGWTVDKYGGDIAWVDSADAVHIVDPNVPGTAATVMLDYDTTYAFPRATNGAWAPTIWLNRPLQSWSVTIASNLSHQAVAHLSGGAVREYVRPTWNGKLASGAYVPTGGYTWTLTATTEDGTVTAGTGPIHLACGAYVFRNYDCISGPSLLGVKSSGEGHWFNGQSNGTLVDNGYTDFWPFGSTASTTSAIVPYGDYNGDGDGDLLVRDGTGVLRAYLGIGESYFNAGTNKTVKIGTGWNIYNLLFTTGDITGDGVYDLLARDKSGALWRYSGKAGGGFASRVRIGTGWQVYTKIVGVGDITGDGKGDLLAVDSSGTLWRYNGTGTGSFTARVKVGTGWNVYNTLIGIGDLNQDGHNDLIGRDASGTLWLYAGLGNGAFRAKTKLATGFSGYKYLF